MKLETTIKAAARRLVAAEIANSWKGGQAPEDAAAIERELALRRKRFNEAVAKIEYTIRQIKASS